MRIAAKARFGGNQILFFLVTRIFIIQQEIKSMDASKISSKTIKQYQNLLAQRGVSEATIKRNLSSLRKFSGWLASQGYLNKDPLAPRKKMFPQLLYRPRMAFQAQRALPYFTYLNFIILAVFLTALGWGLYQQFVIRAPSPLAYPEEGVGPKRYLSFQGRLTDSGYTPITTAVTTRFYLYDSAGTGNPPTGGTLLWDSDDCSLDPDQDGIFAILLGTTSGDGYTCSSATEIPSHVFSENAEVWLHIKVGSENLDPRIQIATVAYALNAETLQGFPLASADNPTPEATMGATARTVPAINPAGNLVIASDSPTIWSTSGTFGIKGQAITIQTDTGTAGNITLAPDGTGVLNIVPTSGNQIGGTVNATNSALTTGALYTGRVENENTGFDFLRFFGGTTPTERFSVGALGNIYTANNLDVGGAATITGTLRVDGAIISNLIPSGTRDLGSSGSNWDYLYVNNIDAFTLQGAVSGNNQNINNLGTLQVNIIEDNDDDTLSLNDNLSVTGNILPSAGNTYDLGSTTAYWNNLYANNIYGGTGGTQGYWTKATGLIYPNNTYESIAVGGTSTSSAKLYFEGTTGNASMSGQLTLHSAGTNYINALSGQALSLRTSVGGDAGLTPIMTITSAGNVGIGTTNPSGLLNLYKDSAGQAEIFRISRNASSYVTFHTPSGNPAAMNVKASGTSSFDIYTTAYGDYTIGDVRFFQDVFVDGNVGIGTTGPRAKLDIAGDASTSGSLVFRGTSPATIDVLNGDDLRFQTSVGGDAVLTPRMTITNAGNVGIGTTGPSYALDVAGEIRGTNLRTTNLQLKDGTNYFIIRNAADSEYKGLYADYGLFFNYVQISNDGGGFQSSSIDGRSALFKAKDTGVGLVEVGRLQGADEPYFEISKAGNIIPTTSSNYDLGSSSKYWNNLYVNNLFGGTGGTQGHWSKSNGLIYPNNLYESVAIGGMSTASAQLYFEGTTGHASISGNLTLTGGGTIGATDMNNLTIGDANTNNVQFYSGSYYLNPSGQLTLATDETINGVDISAGAILDLTGLTFDGSARTITNANQLTLSTTGASSDLILSAGRDITFNDDNLTSAVPLSMADTGLNASLGQGIIDAINDAYEAAVGSGGISGFWTKTSGLLFPNNTYESVAIGGTATSSAKLYFEGTTGNASMSGQLTLHNTGTNYINALSGQALSFRTSVGGDVGLTDRLYITNSGNVGIGTTEPSEELEVAGDVKISGHTAIGSNASVYTTETLEISEIYTNTSGSRFNIFSDIYTNPTANSSGDYTSVWGSTNSSSGNSYNIGTLKGGHFLVSHNGSGTVSNEIGVYSRIDNAGGPDTNARVFEGYLTNSNTISTAYGVHLTLDNSGTINNTYGVYIDNITKGTQTNTPYSFYASDPNAYNYFAGNVGIGTTAPIAPLHISKGYGSNAALIVDQLYSGDLLTASVSGTTRFTVNNSGEIVTGTWKATAIGTQYGGTGQNWSGVAWGSIPYFSNTGVMNTLGPSTAGYVLTTQGASADPTWTDTGSLGTNYWTKTTGLIYPNNTYESVAIGGTATSSAKLYFEGTTGNASMSGALTLHSTGTNYINSLNGQALSFRTSVGGDADLTPKMTITNTGHVGIGTTAPNEQLEITGNFRLPTTTANTGIIKAGANRFIHNFGTNNAFLGIDAGNLTLSGTNNVGSGYQALDALTSGSYNMAYGSGALGVLTSGEGNIALGYNALSSNTDAWNNIAIGREALSNDDPSGYNIAIGTQALYSGGSGAQYNVAIGNQAMEEATWAAENIAIGADTLFTNDGINNVAVGSWALGAATDTDYTTAIGDNALGALTTGDYDTALGFYAGTGITTGSYNTFLGTNTNASSTNISSSIAIGYEARVTANNQLVVGDDDDANANITDSYWGEGVTSATPGDFTFNTTGGSGTNIVGASLIIAGGKGTGNAAGGNIIFKTADEGASGTTLQSITEKMRIDEDGNVGIGTTAPGYKLEVSGGNAQFDGIVYFANGTIYYVDASGHANLNNITGAGTLDINGGGTHDIAGTLNLSGNALTSTGDLTITPGGDVSVAGSVIPSSSSTYNLGSSSLPWNNVYANNIFGSSSGTQGFWTKTAGVLYPNNAYESIAVGGTSTASAKLLFSGPTGNASMSGTLTLFGASPAITTTNMQTLTLGDASTGIVIIYQDLQVNGNDILDSTSTTRLTLGTITTVSGNLTITQNLKVDTDTFFVNASTNRVGIGTTDPQAKLDIAGASSLISNSSGDITLDASSGYISFSSDYISNLGGIYGDLNVTGDILNSTAERPVKINDWMLVQTSTPSAALMVDQTGSGDIFTASTSGVAKFTINNAGRLVNSLIPAATNTYDLGSSTYYWKDLYLEGGTIYFDDTTDATLKYSTSNSRFEFNPSGDGSAEFLMTDTGDLNVAGYATVSGSLAVGYSSALAGPGNAVFSGNVGIGTTDPLIKLHVETTNSSGSVVYAKNLSNNNSADGYQIQIGTSGTDMNAGNEFMKFIRRDGTKIGRIRADTEATADNVVYATSGAGDFAEFIITDEKTTKGDILCLTEEGIIKRAGRQNNRLIGVHSTSPSFVGNDQLLEQENAAPLALVGLAPVKVSSLGGMVSKGESITSSSLLGIGMKATKAEPIVGKALESTNHWNEQNCPVISSLDAIQWPEDNGTNPAKPCFRLPNPSDPSGQAYTYVGKIMVFVNVSWYDPDVYLTDTGELQISTNTTNTTNKYQLTNGNTIIDRIGAFGQAVIGQLKTGLIQTQELITDSLTVNQKIVSPVIESSQIIAENIETTRINAEESKFGKLLIENEQGETVASIDSAGNVYTEGDIRARSASFGGLLSSEELIVSENATIAGELHVGKIYADEIVGRKATFGDLLAATVSASTIERSELEEIESRLSELETKVSVSPTPTPEPTATPTLEPTPTPTETPEATDSGELDSSESTESGVLDDWENWSISDHSDDDILLTSDITITGNLTALGITSLADTSVAGQLMVDATVIIDKDGIQTLPGSTLKLQAYGWGGIDMLDGKVVINTEGNVLITGELIAKKITTGGLILSESANTSECDPNDSECANESGFGPSTSSGFGKLLAVINKEGLEVASIDASGSAFFAQLGIEADYTATRSGAIIAAADNYAQNGYLAPAIKTNATAGIGILPANESEVMIYNPQVTVESLIYVTATTNTENKVLYIKAKHAQNDAESDAEGNGKNWFIVAINEAINKEIRFNWWIIGGKPPYANESEQ